MVAYLLQTDANIIKQGLTMRTMETKKGFDRGTVVCLSSLNMETNCR